MLESFQTKKSSYHFFKPLLNNPQKVFENVCGPRNLRGSKHSLKVVHLDFLKQDVCFYAQLINLRTAVKERLKSVMALMKTSYGKMISVDL